VPTNSRTSTPGSSRKRSAITCPCELASRAAQLAAQTAVHGVTGERALRGRARSGGRARRGLQAVRPGDRRVRRRTEHPPWLRDRRPRLPGFLRAHYGRRTWMAKLRGGERLEPVSMTLGAIATAVIARRGSGWLSARFGAGWVAWWAGWWAGCALITMRSMSWSVLSKRPAAGRRCGRCQVLMRCRDLLGGAARRGRSWFS
jgi:hypothetical protein